jgi:hypothetical protein
MGASRPRPVVQAARLEAPIEEWPYLDEETLLKTRSCKVCMTCHFFRHHPGANGIPLLTCHLHQALIAHGEHLTRSCSGWTANRRRQREWEPEWAPS